MITLKHGRSGSTIANMSRKLHKNMLRIVHFNIEHNSVYHFYGPVGMDVGALEMDLYIMEEGTMEHYSGHCLHTIA